MTNPHGYTNPAPQRRYATPDPRNRHRRSTADFRDYTNRERVVHRGLQPCAAKEESEGGKGGVLEVRSRTV